MVEKLKVSPIGGGRWEVQDDFGIVPKGFVTNGASVPRLFWPILGPVGNYFSASVTHDYYYFAKTVSRAEADFIFLRDMKRAGVGWLSRTTIYKAVRLGGWLAWKR